MTEPTSPSVPSPAGGPVRSIARVATAHASRYLQQLCKHFAHKVPATFDENQGHIAFSIGDCRLSLGENVLVLALAAPDEGRMAELRDVVARHLVRFAFREELRIDWQAP